MRREIAKPILDTENYQQMGKRNPSGEVPASRRDSKKGDLRRAILPTMNRHLASEPRLSMANHGSVTLQCTHGKRNCTNPDRLSGDPAGRIDLWPFRIGG